ncbi:alkaline phosphatase family protein [Mycobacterium gordonae]|uniref:Nucleotide pyrophosphatase n=1 Tax=Mycobacterium gordonae TaxID=1778 RepID=A0A1A6B9D6_MYCGO|nr:nucleotide pyrophosphatase/phosphodiesterase family protein [Mycobacterium gordonae]MBI2699240.1 alkaline phosphatase family protein [Mycobacterium sp.]MCQ4360277.1 alkaline phosphatase family protein [Mycobacterium gordonae]MCV7005500.1 alkaline phosphatase family protein [Mycobacterium gordonae]OBR98905.1 nucleotide pyrophosphatase [Mycobacterium gordonae]ODR22168.1 nucleotide pyrophosphatase [Mycobacterium gordonae]
MPGSICDLLPSTAALLGVPGALDTLGLTESVGDVDRIMVVLVDGLGWHLLPDVVDDAPLLASVLTGGTGRLRQLRCTFPSTTPTSLVSLGTGAQPGQHGILGFTLNIPGTGRVLNHIRWRDEPPVDEWQPLPTWFDRLAHAGVKARALLPEWFIGSGLTEAAYHGALFVPTHADDDYAQRMIDELRATPGLVYGYTADLDTMAHVFGVGSPEWHEAAARIDALLTRLAESLPANAALLVTADHGGFNVAADARIDMDADPRLAAGVRVVAGEPRVRYLHTQPGATADVVATWSELLAGCADVHTREQAVAAGLFGPVSPALLPRIGDVVVVCTGGWAVLATGHEPPESARLVGFHGASSAAEMDIPLIEIL